MLFGIANIFNTDEKQGDDKIEIIATLYPNYDFAQKIGGDKVEVTLLLNSGVDSHNYEPSVKDMKNIADCDIFIYTCETTEPWAESIIDSLSESECEIVTSGKNVDLIETEEFEEEYNVLENTEHTHSSEDLEDYEYDGHIWLNPQNAIKMVNSIANALCSYDPENSDYYLKNAEDYIKEIEDLDKEIEEAIQNLDTDVLVFGGEFAYTYFIERYDLEYVSVYKSCGEEAEPSVSDVKEVIDYINENNITKVFYEELSEGTVAKMISEETDAEAIVFYSLHNVSKEEIENGEDYISIMKKNLENIIN